MITMRGIYDPYLNQFVSPDSIVPDFSNPQSLNRYSYVRGNPLRYNDPSGHRECGTPYDYVCQESRPSGDIRIFYMNGIRQDAFHVIEPKEIGGEYESILYALNQSFGEQNVEVIPVFNTGYKNRVDWRLGIWAESLGLKKPFSNRVANVIEKSLDFAYGTPLMLGERLVLVGSSAGGTTAIEALDILEEKGIYIDQVILRSSAVNEFWLNNVGRVDYLATDPPFWADKINYSADINPFDSIQVKEHIVPGLTAHTPFETAAPVDVQRQINALIVNLINEVE